MAHTRAVAPTNKSGTGMDYLSSNPKYEKELLNELPEKLKSIFQEKVLKMMTGYWKTLAEARAIVIFFKKLNLLPLEFEDIDIKTFRDKDVDFIFLFEGEKIHVEVKGFNPDDETSEEFSSFAIDTGDDDICRALKRANNKLLENSCNIVIIADEDVLHPLGNKKQDELDKVFKEHSYKKISAFIILGPLWAGDPFGPSDFLSGPAFKFTSIAYNENAQKQLPSKLKRILDKNKDS
jgi:hypothetical protein